MNATILRTYLGRRPYSKLGEIAYCAWRLLGCRAPVKRRTGRAVRWQRPGIALVELAITLPIVILLIFGGVDALQLLMSHYLVAWATREAAQQAAIDGGDVTQAQRLAETILDNGITHWEYATITIVCSPTCARYRPITVSVTYEVLVWAPIGPFDTFTIARRATRASEKDGPGASSTSTAGTPSFNNPATERIGNMAPFPGAAPVLGAEP